MGHHIHGETDFSPIVQIQNHTNSYSLPPVDVACEKTTNGGGGTPLAATRVLQVRRPNDAGGSGPSAKRDVCPRRHPVVGRV